MPTITAPDRSYMAGVPEQWEQDFGVTKEGLFTGETPKQFVEDIPVALDQELEAYQAVTLDGDGNIVAATATDPAIGIIMFPVTTESSGELPVGRILRAGCVNPDVVVWDDSYDDETKKIRAFWGAPSPTQIIVRGLATTDEDLLP